jgi:hypothetical protein
MAEVRMCIMLFDLHLLNELNTSKRSHTHVPLQYTGDCSLHKKRRIKWSTTYTIWIVNTFEVLEKKRKRMLINDRLKRIISFFFVVYVIWQTKLTMFFKRLIPWAIKFFFINHPKKMTSMLCKKKRECRTHHSH